MGTHANEYGHGINSGMDNAAMQQMQMETSWTGQPRWGGIGQGATEAQMQPSTSRSTMSVPAPPPSSKNLSHLHKRPSANHLSPVTTPPDGSSSMSLSLSVSPSFQASPDLARMSYSPLLPSNSNLNLGNAGLGMPRGVLPVSLSHQQSSSSPSSSSRPSMLPPSSSYPPHFTRTNSSSSALSISTSPTTTGGQGSPMTPSSPAYATMTPMGQNQHNQYIHHQHHPQPHQQAHSQYSSMDASPVLNTGPSLATDNSRSGTASPAFRVPNPPGSSRPPPQQRVSHNDHTEQQYSQYSPSVNTSSAYYLNDPSHHSDRRQGSYSPSRYALASSVSNNNIYAQQQASSSQSQQVPISPYLNTHPPHQHQSQPHQTLQSPRHPGANANNPYFPPHEIPQASSSQAQLSPAVARQQYSPEDGNNGISPTASSPSYDLSLHSQKHAHGPNHHHHHHHQQTQSLSSGSIGSSSYVSAGGSSSAKLWRQRPRSTGSALRRVREAGDLKPNELGTCEGRRAHPDGGTVSVRLSPAYFFVARHV